VPAGVIFGLTGLAAYFMGSVPTGYLVARARGVDITATGSGNIGATNAFRVLGKGPGTLVLTVDALKGLFAVLLARWFAPGLAGMPPETAVNFAVLAGVCAILGHNFTCWLRFKGGKGIATTAGVLLGLMPWTLVVALAGWLVVFALTRYVSAASLVAAVIVPVVTWIAYPDAVLRVVAFVMGALAIYKHRANIQRLMQGTEPRVGGGPKPTSPEQ
jgi:glycerol-3-phosphate acyltransferase PlsY